MMKLKFEEMLLFNLGHSVLGSSTECLAPLFNNLEIIFCMNFDSQFHGCAEQLEAAWVK